GLIENDARAVPGERDANERVRPEGDPLGRSAYPSRAGASHAVVAPEALVAGGRNSELKLRNDGVAYLIAIHGRPRPAVEHLRFEPYSLAPLQLDPLLCPCAYPGVRNRARSTS